MSLALCESIVRWVCEFFTFGVNVGNEDLAQWSEGWADSGGSQAGAVFRGRDVLSEVFDSVFVEVDSSEWLSSGLDWLSLFLLIVITRLGFISLTRLGFISLTIFTSISFSFAGTFTFYINVYFAILQSRFWATEDGLDLSDGSACAVSVWK